MKAIILVGGEGTRLRPLTDNVVKTMVPVLNKPFLEYIIHHLRRHGINEVVLTLCHKPHQLEEYFGDGSKSNIRLSYVIEDSPLGTAGAIKNAQKHITDSFIVINGDIFTDLDLSGMLHFHRNTKAKITIALTPVDDPTFYGVIESDAQNRITSFTEKPAPERVTTNMINAGTYIAEPDILDFIPENSYFMFEYNLFPKLLEEGIPLYSYQSQDYWIDIGTPEKYLKLHHDLLLGKSSQLTGYKHGNEIHIGKETFIHPTARLTGPLLIGDGCVISKEASLKGPAVLGNGCKIGEGSLITGAILWRNVRVGNKVVIDNSIIGNNSRLQDNSHIDDNCVLGDNVFIAKDMTLPVNSRLSTGTKLLTN